MHEPDKAQIDPVTNAERVERYEERTPVAVPAAVAVAPAGPVYVAAYNYRAVQVVWFVTGLIATVIALRFVLKLLGASPQSSFVGFLYGVTGPLVAPFGGIFPTSGQGFYIFEPAALIAIVIYALIGWGIVTAIRIVTAPKSRRPLA